MSYILNLEKYGIAIIGDITPGFPKPRLIAVTLAHVLEVITPAIIVALIGFIEAISAARHFAGIGATSYYVTSQPEDTIKLTPVKR